MKLLVLFCLVAAAVAAPQSYYQPQYPTYSGGNAVVPIISESNELNPDGSYHYSYQTGDGQQAEARGYLKNPGLKDAEAEVAEGSYSYTAPDGTPITVIWVADENGFRAQGAHLPTPPPIPEAIQKSLAVISQAQRTVPQTQYQPQYQQQQYQQKPRYRF